MYLFIIPFYVKIVFLSIFKDLLFHKFVQSISEIDCGFICFCKIIQETSFQNALFLLVLKVSIYSMPLVIKVLIFRYFEHGNFYPSNTSSEEIKGGLDRCSVRGD